MIQELTTDTLHELIGDSKITFVQFSAGWCGNCRIMKPKFKKLANKDERNQFVIVDAENNPNSRGLAEVNNLPTFAAFKDGKLLGQIQTNKADSLNTFHHEITGN